MREPSNIHIQVAAITDRGLSEKRPLNEDSFLSDPERRIFAVADGVGGAQAGEVASKTAVEVLDEAFRHQVNGTDIEDLMEIAIQRANASIFQMAQESSNFSAMATTVVALQVDGHVATIGHVGDSRLYRFSPDGQLHRETADHSVVEEEVRAGRMTPEQAATHPSRNVISRALGAEPGVEVDMKTIEIDDGTTFLLCSDGITRHIPDNEIRELLIAGQNLDAVCAEMKRRCYERGAEDNLTAVIVRVGDAPNTFADDDERTLVATRPDLEATVDSAMSRTQTDVLPQPVAPVAVPLPHVAAPTSLPPPPVSEREALPSNPVLSLESHARKRSGGGARALLFILLMLIIGGAAFYGGMYFQQQRSDNSASTSASPTPTPPPADPVLEFEKKKREIDRTPAVMVKAMNDEQAAKGLKNPLDSTDPEFLYLYGRGLMLMGDNINAIQAFERANANLKENATPLYDKLKIESRLAALGVAFRLRTTQPNVERDRRVLQAFDELINKNVNPITSAQQ
jgi:serine/threonine protein phosphatase PrpC